jgi:hypothetical protein
MTRDDIISLARDSGMELYGLGKNGDKFIFYLERFAALVVAAVYKNEDMFTEAYAGGYAAGVAKEREACAELLDDMADQDRWSNYYKVAAMAIRARGKK